MFVFDLDNTLSDAEHRSHLARARRWDEFHSCAGQDEPVRNIVLIYKTLQADGNRLMILTGRPSNYVDLTNEWLQRQQITCEWLLMRPEDNFKQDHDFKLTALEAARIQLDIPARDMIVFEDRASVVDCLRGAGYTVLHVRESLY